jgi:4-hydroxyacetophenone monooxygenase
VSLEITGAATVPVQPASLDVDTVRRAVDAADPNVLRITLFQLTGDPDLAKMRVTATPVRGGASFNSVLAEEHHDEVRAKSLSYLLNQPTEVPGRPSDAEILRMMEMLSNETFSAAEFRFGLEELALDEFPRDVTWNNRPPDAVLRGFHVAVIGAGISGIAAAVQLERLGIPYTVLERQAGLGGTWHLNRYPDARVDVTSYMYQFKFEKNYPWTEYFASQPETEKYLEHIAAKHDVKSKIRFNVEVTAAEWDEDTATWILTTRADGSEDTLSANVIISASGLFSTPNLPDIDGINAFAGSIFHTAAWPGSLDLSGKKVALIGNGSSGTQLMPRVAEVAGRLYAFQRTPNWVAKIEGYRTKVAPELRWLFDNMPFYWNWYCYSSYIATTRTQASQVYDREWQARGGLISERNDALRAHLTEYIRTEVGGDPDLAAKCTPTYAPMARRLVVDNGWYRALTRENVELVTDGISRITPAAIISTTGTEYPVDVIILGAGFQVSRYLWPVRYQGRDGRTLEDLWSKDGARSYLGIVMPGFPNMFMFYGPQGQPRAGGFYSWAEIWARYTLKAITAMIESGSRSMECRQDIYQEYNDRLDRENENLIWEREGAGGYLVNDFGRSAVNMPWPIHEYHAWVIDPTLTDYHMT